MKIEELIKELDQIEDKAHEIEDDIYQLRLQLQQELKSVDNIHDVQKKYFPNMHTVVITDKEKKILDDFRQVFESRERR